MNLSVGIVGLPNVGKSTLFNALLKKQQALAANYPFATIEPNVGIVGVPDSRLEKLAEIVAGVSTSEESDVSLRSTLPPSEVSTSALSLPPIKSATVEFLDIAGLVKGASEGAGLGNKFLSHIREVSVIAHVVRAFEDSNVIREGSTNPKSDYETIRTELILADLQTLENANRKTQNVNQQLKSKISALEKLQTNLNQGTAARDVVLDDEEREAARDFHLLTSKPEIIVLNVSEDSLKNAEKITQNYAEKLFGDSEPASQRGEQARMTENIVVICAQIESELASLSDEEQKEYLKDLGLESSGLERLIKKAYETLGLISFLTAGEKEVKAWTIKKGANAVEAAGEIHTDFMKKFIKAEVIDFADFVSCGGWKKCREVGKARMESRDYIMKDGDVVEFKIGA